MRSSTRPGSRSAELGLPARDGGAISPSCECPELLVDDLQLARVSMRVDIGAQDGVHSREMPSAARLEPIDNVAVETRMHGGLPARHDDAGLSPKIRSKQFRLGRVGSRSILAARSLGFDFVK